MQPFIQLLRKLILLGGKSLQCVVDVRDNSYVQAAVEQAVKTFGWINILVNNVSAIRLTPSEMTPMGKFDFMHQVNVRGTFQDDTTVSWIS